MKKLFKIRTYISLPFIFWGVVFIKIGVKLSPFDRKFNLTIYHKNGKHHNIQTLT